MKRRPAPPILLDDPEPFVLLARAAGIPPGTLAERIAISAARGLRFHPDALRLGRPVNLGHTDAVVAELRADDFPYIVKIRAGRSLSAERESVAEAAGGISVELRRFLLPPVHVETLARSKSLPGGVLEFALYGHGRAAGGWQSGLASWREILLHSPRLLPESALAVARVWRTENARLAVKHVPPASSPVYRDKADKLARASAPPERPGGERVPLDKFLGEGPPSGFIPDWLRTDGTRRKMTGMVLGDDGGRPRAPTAPGFMHGDLHGDNILLHYADDAPSGFSVIDLGTASSRGCALYDWAKLTLDLVETQYSTPVFLEMPSGRVAERAGIWCGELALRLIGNDASGQRWRAAEEASLEAALHLRSGLTPESASGRDLVKALFLNALFGLRYVSYRNTAWDDPALVRNVVLHASAADAFARAALGTGGGKKRESGAEIVVPFDLFKKPPGRAFRKAWLAGRRPALIPAGAVDLYLRGISPEPGGGADRAELLEKAAARADDSGDAFLADCCRVCRADAARDGDPDERRAVLTSVIERPFSASPDSPHGWRERLLAGLAHHYRGVLTATRAAADIDAALADLAKAAALLNALPFTLEAARANNSLGHYAGFRHDLARAGQYLNEAWFAREPFDPPWEAAATLGCLATHARRLGDPRGALVFYQADLARCDAASRGAIEQKAAETRTALVARERRRGVLADPVLLEAAMTPVRETLANEDRRGPFWDKCRLMAEVVRIEGGLPADTLTDAALAAGRRIAARAPSGGMDYPSSYALRWLGRLESALGEREAARRLLKAVSSYWRDHASAGELLSSRLDAEGMADAAISQPDAARLKAWSVLMDDLHGFRRDLSAPPELSWRIEPALRRLEQSLTGEAEARRDAVREMQMFLEY